MMKAKQIPIAAIIALLMVSAISLTQCTEVSGLDESLAPDKALMVDGSLKSALSDDIAAGILFMREEEKLARDVYLYLYDIHPLRPFLNISKSEQAHMNAILCLIDTLGLVDPVGDNPEGVFMNEELQELYTELTERGGASREEALKVGALIEEVDILDLQERLAHPELDDQVTRVYTNLCKASEQHLRAFVGVLKLYDVEYEPVLLDPDQFKQIIED